MRRKSNSDIMYYKKGGPYHISALHTPLCHGIISHVQIQKDLLPFRVGMAAVDVVKQQKEILDHKLKNPLSVARGDFFQPQQKIELQTSLLRIQESISKRKTVGPDGTLKVFHQLNIILLSTYVAQTWSKTTVSQEYE